MSCMAAPKKKIDRPVKRQVNMRLDEPIVEEAESFAERHHRTFTSVVEVALREYLDRHGKKPPVEQIK